MDSVIPIMRSFKLYPTEIPWKEKQLIPDWNYRNTSDYIIDALELHHLWHLHNKQNSFGNKSVQNKLLVIR